MFSIIIKLVLLAGTVCAIKEFGFWESNEQPRQAKVEAMNNVRSDDDEDKPALSKIMLDDDDKRELKRKADDLRRKFCTKGGICEPPPPKKWDEAFDDAWKDTYSALKKLPDIWSRFARDIQESICEFFKGKEK
ncbi:uncharacterized protein LOC115633504 [Scaptodrosophila lebanonensis]|uniref:Uncharacterized protein LOC115633504 n=1 Tax=Drosophila lebanonensis TaxID=7225 RepID=A0A6J2UEN7_DROLE|nr:uncharacterized protein LOC115633504 [Scaptodrosophila lebanonensis]